MKTILVVFVGMLALVGFGACSLGSGIAQSPTAAPPTAVPVNRTAVPPAAPANGNAGTDFTLRESDLNQNIAQGLSGGEISNAHIDIHPGELADVTATISTGGLNLSPKASVKISVQNGRMVLDVLNVEVGGFGVPSSLIEPQIAQVKQAAETELNKQFDTIRASSGLTLQSVTTNEGSLTLHFAP